MKKLITILLLTASVAASASELPQWEVAGFPITPHQLSVLQPKNVGKFTPACISKVQGDHHRTRQWTSSHCPV